MPVVPPTYIAGYKQTVTIDSVVYPTTGWTATADSGSWDATNSMTNGWGWKETGIRNLSISTTLLASATMPVPKFDVGDTVPAIFTTDGTNKYVGTFRVEKRDAKPDLKGGVMYDCTFDIQGPPTTNLVYMAPTPTPTGS